MQLDGALVPGNDALCQEITLQKLRVTSDTHANVS